MRAIESFVLIFICLSCGGWDRDVLQYRQRLGKTNPDDPAGHWTLAQWCRQKELTRFYYDELDRVLKLDPDHQMARKALGYEKKEKKWERDRYWDAVEGVVFPEAKQLDTFGARGYFPRRITDMILDRKRWRDAFESIDKNLGLFTSRIHIEVKLVDEADGEPARGWGQAGQGVVTFNMAKLPQLEAKMDKTRKAIRKGAKAIVPPTDLTTVVRHELTHVFQGKLEPSWVSEGMAAYIQRDPALLYSYTYRMNKAKKTLPDLEREYSDHDAYPRGWLFFDYVRETTGLETVRDLADLLVNRHQGISVASETVLKKPWKTILKEEQAWSLRWLRKKYHLRADH